MESNMRQNIFRLLETGLEAIDYIAKSISNNQIEFAIEMLQNIRILVMKLETILESEKNNFLQLSSIYYCKNLLYSVDKVLIEKKLLNEIFWFEIRGIFFELNKTIKFELDILPNKDKCEEYRARREETILEWRKGIRKKEARFEVSIILVAYNKLEYTKKAIESIYQYTDFSAGDIELITVNNGSNDETQAYFAELPNEKKINLKYNILGNGIYYHCVEGKYMVGFSNDVIATPNWLSNLLTCIKSDDRIFWVVPTCNESGISNRQGIPIDYKNDFTDINKMENFAAKYNKSDPNKWEERSLLMPFIWLGKSELIKKGDFLDQLYTQHEFIDDDLSTSLRRAGFKQILAKDTFMHHFGSVSLCEGQRANNSLNNMRKVYFDKWGVDAWESRAIFLGLEECLAEIPLRNVKTALFLEPLFGGSFLQIKNFYHKKGSEITAAKAIVTDERYIDDAKGLFNKVVIGRTIMDALSDIRDTFDIISAGRFLAEMESSEILNLLEHLYGKLKKGGMMILPIQNYRNTSVILQLLLYGSIASYSRPFNEFAGCSIDKIKQALDEHSYLCNYDIIMCENHGKITALTEKVIEFINENVGEIHNTDQERFRKELNSMYVFLCIGK